MALRDLKSNLKTLKVDKDRPGGGSSGLPYIKGGLPEDSPAGEYIADLARYSSDGTVRGGLFSTVSSTTDSIRISRFLNDFPKGLLFTSKQVGLAKSNPLIETETRGERSNIEGLTSPNINTQIYNLNSNLLSQVAIQGNGEHIPYYGFNKKDLLNDKNKYEKIVSKKSTNENRLVTLYNNKILPKVPDGVPNYKKHLGISDNSETLFDYTGGPGSSYGDGDTIIKRSVNTPRSYSEYLNNPLSYSSGYNPSFKTTSEDTPYAGDTLSSLFNKKINLRDQNAANAISTAAISGLLPNFELLKALAAVQNEINNNHNNISDSYSGPLTKRYEEGPDFIRPEQSPSGYNFGNTMAYSKLLASKDNLESYTLQDFRSKTIEPSKLARDYSKYNIETRLKLGDPGARPSFQRKFINQVGDGIGQDKINLLPLYTSTGDPIIDNDVRDMIKFCIEVINNDGIESTVPLHFRAYITDFNDNIGADWNSQRYMGRGENFYTYQGFTREVSFNLKVAAQSKQEMMPLYQKLNYLASSLMPDYNSNGFMRGNLHKLTVGEWFYRTPGILKSMNISIDNNYPWEIKYDEPETGTQVGNTPKSGSFGGDDFQKRTPMGKEIWKTNKIGGTPKFQNSNSDADMMELPQILSINFTFTPILNNLPRLAKDLNGNFTTGSILISDHGDKENFIKRITN